MIGVRDESRLVQNKYVPVRVHSPLFTSEVKEID